MRAEGTSGDFNCGRFSSDVSPGKLTLYDHCSENVSSDYMCETAGKGYSAIEQRDKGADPIQMPVISSTTASFPVPTVVCPARHLTHSFMAFDSDSACLLPHDYRVKNETWSGFFTPLTSLPAMMACESGTQHVPYSLVCDHQQHCRDGSDESFCFFPPCSQGRPLKCLLSAQVCSVGWNG